MQIDLADKLAIVTGSTAGIGFAIAKGLAAAGANVVLNGRTQARVDEAIARLNSELDSLSLSREASIQGVAADLSSRAGLARSLPKSPTPTFSSTTLASSSRR